MKKALWLILFIACVTELMAGRRPDRKFMIEQMVLVNERFMARGGGFHTDKRCSSL